MKDFIDLVKLAKSDKAAAEHATDFDPPIYNIWKHIRGFSLHKYFASDTFKLGVD
jgi:hypothetical protein